MSVSVTFSNGSKRDNSTKQLTMSTTHNCVFKNGCSMLAPTLLLEISSSAFPDYTAFKIEDRYYKVTDIRSVRDNLFEVSGEVDVLATYKSNILATTAYVIYDSTSNSELPDNRLPMKTSKNVQVATTACPLVPDSGCYILSLTGSNGTTGIYKASDSELAALIDDVAVIRNNLFPSNPMPVFPTKPTGSSVPEWLEYVGDVVAWFGEYFAYAWGNAKYPFSQLFGSGHIPENIRECKYIPFNRGTTYGPNRIYLGTFETQVSLSKLNTYTIQDSATVTIPWQTNDYRRRSPYTDVYLYIPYIGMTKLSSENLIGQSTVTVDYTLSLRDGSLLTTISSGGEIIGQYPGNVAISVPVGISNINAPKAAQALISGAVSAASKNLGGIGMAALQFGDALTPNYTCIGGLDGSASIAANQNITCYTVFHDTIVAPNSELRTIGSPSMCPKSLATLTDYVQTMSASVDGAMTADERRRINNLLDSGIYIE